MSATGLANEIEGLLGSAVGYTVGDAKQGLRQRVVTIMKPLTDTGLSAGSIASDDKAAADLISETPVFFNAGSGTLTLIQAVFICGTSGITANANTKTITLSSRTSAGGSATVMATATTPTSGNLTVGQQLAFTLSATPANRIVPIAGCVTFKTTISGGCVLPYGPVVMVFTED